MSEDQFTKLFKHMNSHFDAIEKKLDEKASQKSVDNLTNTMDGFAEKLDNSEVEQAARDYQYERLFDWARKVSKKTGIPIRDL